jgi:hypothetical protein
VGRLMRPPGKLGELWLLRDEGIRNGKLHSCEELMKLIPTQLVPESARPHIKAAALGRVLQVVARRSDNCDVHAAAEFIGIRDERFSDPVWTDKEHKPTPLNMRTARAGRRLKRPLVSIKRIEQYTGRCLNELLQELEQRLLDPNFIAGIATASFSSITPHVPFVPSNQERRGVGTEEPPSVEETVRKVDHGPPEPCDYIHRPRHEQAFREAEGSQARRIGFVGEPGNGKTELLDQIVREEVLRGRNVVYLHAHDVSVLSGDIVRVLSERNLESRHFGWQELRLAFIAFISSAAAPDVLAIDNVPSAAFLSNLLPSNTQPLVVYTSRESCISAAARRETREISVGSMKREEAGEFARALLPGIPTSDIDRLCSLFGNRPIAIEHACLGMLADGLMSVEQLRSAYRSRPAATMKRAVSPVQQTLTWIYEQILQRLNEDEDKSPLQLLQLVSFLSPRGIPVEFVTSALAILRESEDEGQAALDFQVATRELRRLHLIEVKDSSISIHSLTQEIILDLLHDKKKQSSLALQAAAAPLFIDEMPAQGLEPELLAWMSHLERFVTYLSTELTDDEVTQIGLDHTRAVMIASQRQLGAERYFLRGMSNAFTDEVRDATIDAAWRGCWRETLWELLSLQYAAGTIPPNDYLGMLFGRVDFVWRDGQLIARPTTAVDVVYHVVPALIGCGHYTHARELLEHLIVNEDPHPAAEIVSADTFELMGEICVAHGDWLAAEGRFREAIKAYDKLGNSLRARRGRAKTLMAWWGAVLISNRQEESLEEVTSHVRQLDREYDRLDELSKARRAALKAKHLGQTFLFNHHAVVHGTLSRETSMANWLAEQFVQACWQADKSFAHTGHRRELFDLSYEITLIRLFCEDEDSDLWQIDLNELRRQVQESGDVLNAYKIRLAEIRMSVLKRAERPHMLDECIRMAYDVADRFEHAYWFCELLATACILSAIFGHGPSKLLEAAASEYEQIGLDFKATGLRDIIFESSDRCASRARDLMVSAIIY